MVIAVDGPAGAGKSTLAKQVAQRLNITYIDSGATYRGISYYIYQQIRTDYSVNRELEQNQVAMERIWQIVENELEQLELDVAYKDEICRIYINQQDVTDSIRTEEISILASIISTNPKVRQFLVERQRRISQAKSVIMDGRDIATVVFPQADYKFYITAQVEKRAQRRYQQLIQAGQLADLKDIVKDIQNRDYRDMNREHSPLRKDEQAVVIDTTNQTVSQAVAQMLEVIAQGEAD